ncbi:ribose-phosphate diphosphokinase [Desulfoferrobacter suflitae]|uniref:ribose-phosphate diphosphokinase n=1 Tax=Desulfoferrobacter suflitae TaxID=2865782 RepID=UPI00216430E0|nr:ribose-phosphate pyrophosphokinase [Desulfoferrobacter suflitae]
MRNKALIVITGNSNPLLSHSVCSILGLTVGQALVGRFSDGEVRVEVNQNVRGLDVYVIQSLCPPVNENLIELLVLVDALKRASARRINVVIPYYGYGRQDQKDKPRVSIAAKVVADLLTVAGLDRLVTIDLHATQIQGYFDVPVDHLYGTEVLVEDAKDNLFGDDTVVAPDAGGVERARVFASRLNVDLAIMDHRGTEVCPSSSIVGEVKGRPVIILDDMVDTGQTLVRAAEAAQAAGASCINAYCVHAVLSGDALRRIERSPIRSLTVTDTIPHSKEIAQSGKLRIVSIAPLLAEVIKRVHNEDSVSALFR